MIYLDSSALLKLLVQEAETAALGRWISKHASVPLVSSELATVEVIRAARRMDVRLVSTARSLVSELDLVPLSGAVIEAAAEVGKPDLRSLDALHLASALSIQDELTAFVAYDIRLLKAASASGIPTSRPR